ncbi:MAG: hypothetical protein H6636_06925 [Anaerolineales bacterium]|nr:hypothetical protein [Anaerolineales bacterium]
MPNIEDLENSFLYGEPDPDGRKPVGFLHPQPGTREERLWRGIRQGLIIVLGAIEDYWGWPRSIPPRRLRSGHDQG